MIISSTVVNQDGQFDGIRVTIAGEYVSIVQHSASSIDLVNISRNQARDLMRTLAEYLDDGKDAEFVAENA